MNQQEASQLSIELMEISEACYLTTIDEKGLPQTRAMLNLRNARLYPGLVSIFDQHVQDFCVYFTTNSSSQKVRQIQNNPNVSVYYAKPDEWRGLMLGGVIEIVTDMKIKEMLWQDDWTMYYPGGPTDKDFSILRLNPQVLNLYHQLSTYTIRMDR